jgi:hypothetical protein
MEVEEQPVLSVHCGEKDRTEIDLATPLSVVNGFGFLHRNLPSAVAPLTCTIFDVMNQMKAVKDFFLSPPLDFTRFSPIFIPPTTDNFPLRGNMPHLFKIFSSSSSYHYTAS